MMIYHHYNENFDDDDNGDVDKGSKSDNWQAFTESYLWLRQIELPETGDRIASLSGRQD